jgi:hypothetical protein
VLTVKLKAPRKLLRAWELSNNLSDLLKPKASLRKYAETAVFGTKPLVIYLLVRIITIHLHNKNYYLVWLGLLEMYNHSQSRAEQGTY